MAFASAQIAHNRRIDMNEPANFCRYPCNDPDGDAKRLGYPPKPPPEREPPRKIPGFPNSDQGSTADERSQSTMTYTSGEASELTDVEVINQMFETDHEGDNLLEPPYKIRNRSPSGALSHRTTNTNIKHANGLYHYDTHNLYGTSKWTGLLFQCGWACHKLTVGLQP